MGKLIDLFPIATEYYNNSFYSLLIFVACSLACVWITYECLNMYLRNELKTIMERLKFSFLVLIIIYTGSLGAVTVYLYLNYNYFQYFKLF